MKEKLYRSRKNRVLGGVAGGLAEYLNLDPILVRIIFVIIALVNGFGIFLYIVLWIVVQEEELDFSNVGSSSQSSAPESESSGSETESPGEESKKTKADEKPFDPAEFYKQYHTKKSNTGRIVAGVILIGIGFLFLAEKYFSYFVLVDFFPLLLIIAGVALLWNSSRKKQRDL